MNAGTTAIRVKGVPFPIEFADWTHDRLYHTVEFEGGDTTELQAFVGAQGSTIPGGSRSLTAIDTNIPRTGDTGLQEGWEMMVYSIQIAMTREMARGGATTAFALQDESGANFQFSRVPHVGGYDPAIASGGSLHDFLRKTFHLFQVNQKVQSEGPADEYPSGSGISAAGVTTSLEVANNGVPSPRDQSAFVLPIWIRPNIAYVSKLRPTAALGIGGGGAFPFATVNGYFDWAAAGGGGAATAIGFDIRVTLEGLLKRPVV